MIFWHYDNTSISCNDEQYTSLILTTQTLAEECGAYIAEDEIIDSLYQNDDIYYSAKFLFESKNDDDFMRYCCLGKLIYYHCIKNVIHETDVDSIIYYLNSF